MSKRLMTLFEPHVEAAVAKHSQGDDVTYEIGFTLVPQIGPAWMVGLFLPNPAEIGEHLNFVAVLAPAAKVSDDGPSIDKSVGDALDQLRAMRSSVLSETPVQGLIGPNGEPVAATGAVGPPGGS